MHPVCPRCDKPLVALVFRDIEIDMCGGCRGLWMDAGELEDLLRATSVIEHAPEFLFTDAQGGPPRRRALCPRCDRPMRVVQPKSSPGGGVQFDTCPAGHGLWFDRFELRDLLATFPPETNASAAIGFLDDFFGDTRPATPGGGDAGLD